MVTNFVLLDFARLSSLLHFTEMITIADKEHLAELLKEQSPEVPWITVEYSSLGGEEHASLFPRISLDKTWINNIYHNSRYSIFSVRWNNMKERYVVEQISSGKMKLRFRKSSACKNLDAVASKISTYLESCK